MSQAPFTQIDVVSDGISISTPKVGTVTIRADHEAYKGGRLDAATRKNNPPGRSGDAAIYESQNLMNRRTRSAYLNNALTKRTVDVFRDLVVGRGINAFADPIDHSFGWSLDLRPETLLEDAFDYALESDELFADYCEGECDVSGRSFAEMQQMAISEMMVTGDVLFIECTDKNPDRIVPLCYQMIEREQIDSTKDRPRAPGQNAIVNGFEIDQYGREIAVHLYDDHPYTSMGYGQLRESRIPASQYLHVFRGMRPSQTSGASGLHAAYQPVVDRDTYLESELRTAIKQSLHALIMKLEDPTSEIGLIDGDLETGEVTWGDSPVAHKLGKDDDVQLIESARPNNNAGSFFEMIEHDIAAATNISYYSLTGRFDKTNYGGFRGAMNLEDAQILPVQNWLGRKLILPIRRRFNDLAIGLGKIKSISPSEFKKERRRFQRFDVIGPGRNLLEPSAENEAKLGMLRGGLSTLKIECARQGLHWIRVLRQIHLENRITDWLGIVLDHSKGQGGQATGSTRSNQQDQTQ